jgi:hypothetical protein
LTHACREFDWLEYITANDDVILFSRWYFIDYPAATIINQFAMKIEGQVKPGQEYEYDEYSGQYHLKDGYQVIRRRVALAQNLMNSGLTKKEAWARVFKTIPKTFEDPLTGLPYPPFEPDNFTFP